MVASIILLNRALRAWHLGREVSKCIHISVFLLRSRLFFIHTLYYKNLHLDQLKPRHSKRMMLDIKHSWISWISFDTQQALAFWGRSGLNGVFPLSWCPFETYASPLLHTETKGHFTLKSKNINYIYILSPGSNINSSELRNTEAI